jgi:hypothetical protein
MSLITNHQDTITKIKEKCKVWWEAHEHDLFVVAVMVLVSAIIFGAGRWWLTWFYEVQPHKIVIEENAFSVSPKQGLRQARFLASINGTKYYPVGADCKAANRIKEENRIWFASEKEAREMGYTPSAQC